MNHGGFTNRFCGFARRFRGSRLLSTLADKNPQSVEQSSVEAAIAADIAGVTACKTPPTVSSTFQENINYIKNSPLICRKI